MSRFEESKLMEHDGRIEAMAQELQCLIHEKPKKSKMTKFRLVAIEFKEDKYKEGESQVNQNLSSGYEITKDFQTESGIVIVMTKWKDQKEIRKDVNLCTYFPPKIGVSV